MRRDPVEDAGGSIPAKRWLALAVLLTGGIAVAVGAGDALGLDALRRHQDLLLRFVEANPLLAPLAYVAGYAALVAAAVPGAGLLTLVGGYLFGWLEASAYALAAQLFGATAVFLVARLALRDVFLARAGPRLRTLRDGFRENALSYLVAIRVSGLFPNVIVNGLPGALDVPLRTYVVATVIGLVPGTLIYTTAGDGLAELLTSRRDLALADLATPQILLSLLGLAALALLPAAYHHRHRLRGRRRGHPRHIGGDGAA